MGACCGTRDTRQVSNGIFATSSEIKTMQLMATKDSDISELHPAFTEAKVLRVIDGDTFQVAAWHDNRIYKFTIRLHGVNAPELRKGTPESRQKGLDAKNYVSALILNKLVGVSICPGKGGKVVDSFGRILAKISIGGVDLSADLLARGMAVVF